MGLQIAKDLAARGLTVLIESRSRERGESAVKEVGQGAFAFHLEVTDQASITSAAERVWKRVWRLDVSIQNAAISNTKKQQPGQSVEEYTKTTRPSNVALDEMRLPVILG
ncbi:SDR family NAD(P)-dependent oxidoreductase [Paraburkholderia sp. SIMBA_049]